MTGQDETREWARRHEVAWEIEPLYETVAGKGRRQTGYELRIYAQLGPDVAAAEELKARAGQIARDVAPMGDLPLEFEVRAYDTGEYERPETGFADEIVVPVALTFEDADHPPTTQTTGAMIAAIEEKLLRLGLKPRAWDSQR